MIIYFAKILFCRRVTREQHTFDLPRLLAENNEETEKHTHTHKLVEQDRIRVPRTAHISATGSTRDVAVAKTNRRTGGVGAPICRPVGPVAESEC